MPDLRDSVVCKKVMIHRYEYGRCFRMKMLGLLICLMSCLDFLIIYVHSELDTSRQMCARDKLIAKKNRAGVNTAISAVVQSKII